MIFSNVTKLFVFFIFMSFVSLPASAQERKDLSEEEKQIQMIADDADFTRAIEGTFKFVHGIQKGLLKLDVKERGNFISSLKSYTEEHKSYTPETGKDLFDKLSKISGVSDKDISNIGDIGRKLFEKYPILKEGPAATAQAAYRSGGIEYNFRDIDPDRECDEACQCLRDCAEEARIASNQAGFEAFFDFATDPSIGNFIRWMLLGVKLHEIAEEEIECKKLCMDWPEGFDCQADSECEEDEYCHKPIGNPVNSCYPKKDLGVPCSGDRKCLSGCCKYHFLTNPIQMVCRPADKCN